MAASEAPRRSREAMVAAGAAAAGIAGGLALGSRGGSKHRGLFDHRPASGTADDVHEIRAQLDQVNRRSPLEVVLDGLTHRRGAHRREG